nr:transketolase C-terminal domain-containing protein [Anaerotignum sp.]
MVVQGYMISEDECVLIPVNVCYDGFYSSHLTEGVDLPTQKEVDEFLPSMVAGNHPVLGPDNPFALDPLTSGSLLMKYRKNHLDAMSEALSVIDEVDKKFAEKFGRSYGGTIEEYRSEDADIVIVTIARKTGTGKDAVDIAREKGIKAGLIKLRFIRPFPAERIAKALEGKKAFCVFDRSVCFGWSQGPMHMEVKSAVANFEYKLCHFSVIGGLCGADISLQEMLVTIDISTFFFAVCILFQDISYPRRRYETIEESVAANTE